eukprot:6922511-Prymnesium_polylepis.1
MRAILIDWLVAVQIKFKLTLPTLYMGVSLVDRYLERREVNRNKLQLVGMIGLYIAAKFEEVYPPEAMDMVFICDKCYTHDEILRMEGCMLRALDFQISTPNALTFLHRFLAIAAVTERPAAEAAENDALPRAKKAKRAAPPCCKTWLLAHYLAELTLQECGMLKHLPSAIAAAALNLALSKWKPERWVRRHSARHELTARGSRRAPRAHPGRVEAVRCPPCAAPRARAQTAELEQQIGYTKAALEPCLDDLRAIVKAAPNNNLRDVFKKYSTQAFREVAKEVMCGDKAMLGASVEASVVLSFLKSQWDQSDAGCTTQEVCAARPVCTISEARVREAIEFLSHAGHIHTTIDEEHFKAC